MEHILSVSRMKVQGNYRVSTVRENVKEASGILSAYHSVGLSEFGPIGGNISGKLL